MVRHVISKDPPDIEHEYNPWHDIDLDNLNCEHKDNSFTYNERLYHEEYDLDGNISDKLSRNVDDNINIVLFIHNQYITLFAPTSKPMETSQVRSIFLLERLYA